MLLQNAMCVLNYAKRAVRIIIETDDPVVIECAESFKRHGRAKVTFDSDIPRTLTNAEITEAIKKLTTTFATNTQWVAIYRILVDYYDYPAQYSEFCKEILAKHNIECDYQAIQKGIGYGILTKKHKEWLKYKPKPKEIAFPRQLRTANLFLELLKHDNIR